MEPAFYVGLIVALDNCYIVHTPLTKLNPLYRGQNVRDCLHIFTVSFPESLLVSQYKTTYYTIHTQWGNRPFIFNEQSMNPISLKKDRPTCITYLCMQDVFHPNASSYVCRGITVPGRWDCYLKKGIQCCLCSGHIKDCISLCKAILSIVNTCMRYMLQLLPWLQSSCSNECNSCTCKGHVTPLSTGGCEGCLE